jgi:hypothetical protein
LLSLGRLRESVSKLSWEASPEKYFVLACKLDKRLPRQRV